jgi:hypothetical protein
MNSKPRGGARAGAGRKPSTRIRVCVMLTPENLQFVSEHVGPRTRSKIINQMLDRYRQDYGSYIG